MSARANPRPSQSSFHQIRGLRFHLRRWPGNGSGPIKLLLHGWLDLSATWQRMVEALPPDWTILAPDQRGFGLSQGSGDTYWFYDYLGDLDGLINELALDEPVDLIGHSMGSQVAALYAGVRPEKIRRLVALDGFYLPRQDPKNAPRQLRNWLDDLRKPATPKRYPDLDTLARKIASRQPGLDEEAARFVADCWAEKQPDGNWALLGDPRHRQRGALLYRDEEARAIFSQVRAPTLILDGAKSHLSHASDREHRRARLDCFSQRKELVIADAGHMLHFDAPETTAAHITDFLDAP